MRVVLDPGHVAGYNKGAISGYAEGTAMYHYAHQLAAKLRTAGLDVAVTRAKVTDNPTLTARGKAAKGADLFVSLHSNGVDNPTAYGVSTFYSIKRPGDAAHADRWCKQLAGLIRGGTKVRGASTRKGSGDWDYYTVIKSAVDAGCPHVYLIEHGFHSNPAECTWLMDPTNLDAMSALECDIICEILGVKASGGEHPTMGAKQVNTPGDTLNVRNTANASGAILGTLAHGSVVDVVGIAGNGWVLVRQGGLKGWVNGKYLSPVKDEFVPYVVRVTADVLNIRKGPGVEHAVAGQIKDKGSFTIVEEKDGWGRLKSGAGWISLKYTEKR